MNAVKEGHERGLAGVAIEVRDSQGNLVGSATTDDGGCCSFTQLVPGTYLVSESRLPGFFSTTSETAVVKVVAGQTGAAAFGNRGWYTVIMPIVVSGTH